MSDNDTPNGKKDPDLTGFNLEQDGEDTSLVTEELEIQDLPLSEDSVLESPDFEPRVVESANLESGGNKYPDRESTESDALDKGEAVLNSDSPSRTLDFLELIYGVLVQPRETFKYVGQKPPIVQALAFLFIGILVNFLVNAGELRTLPAEAGLPSSFAAALMPLFLVGLVAALLAWFINAATVTLISQLFGGAGNGPGLLAAFSFATLPFLIAGILQYLIGIIVPGPFLVSIIGSAGLIWFIYLNIVALQTIEHLSRGRAMLVYFAVPLSIMVSVIVFAVAMISVFAPLIGTFPLQ